MLREDMVTELKRAMESRELEILPNVEQMKQFRRTKRKADGKIDQPGTMKRSHYDRFWATAYAAYGIAAGRRTRSPYEDHSLLVVMTGGGRRGLG